MKKYIISIICLLNIVSCNKQSIIEPNQISEISNSITVEEARIWYQNNQKTYRADKEADKPIWGDAVQKTISKDESIVTVPLILNKAIAFKITDKRAGKSKKEDDNFMSSDIKMNLVFTKVKDKIESFEMRIISEDDYYLKKKKTKLTLNDFDGYVYIFDSNKNFVSGLLYQDGKKVGDLGNNSRKGRILDQVEICVDWHSQVCADGQGCYDWIYMHTTCNTVEIDGSAGSIFTTALEAAMSGGSSSSLSSMLQFPGIQDLWSHLNPTEQAYFIAKWWLLPDAYNAYRAAEDYVFFYYCNNNDDGNWNAFKHAFWAAMLSATVGPRTALEITDNHEVGQDIVNQSMDLFNNNLGINTFKQISSQVAAEPIANKKTGIILNAILQKIAQGQGRRLLPENVDISLQTLTTTTNANRCR